MIEVADSGGTVLTNEYDGNHHRIQKVVGADTFDYYYNDKWQMIAEAKNGSTFALYVWHLYYIDALAVRMRAADMHYFLHDANFNVTAAYDITSGSATDRQVVERYAYTPYGEVTILDANFSVDADQLSDIDNQHLYTGRERDPETGLQLNRYRWYHALLGRWVSRDPVGYRGSKWNLYEYARSRPTYSSDPSGEKDQNLVGIINHGPNKGLPIRLIQDLLNHGSLGWWTTSERIPFYRYNINVISLPEWYWDSSGNVDCPNLKCTYWRGLYNELWHAWWDQVLEERDECEWLYQLIRKEAAEVWTNGLSNSANYEDMANEAMSETLDKWIDQTCKGQNPTYESAHHWPDHNDTERDDWWGNSFADVPLSKELYNLLMHAIEHGCDKVGDYPPWRPGVGYK